MQINSPSYDGVSSDEFIVVDAGVGAYLGLAKVISGGDELTSPDGAPESIVYEVIDSTATTMTLNINVSWGDWTFKFIKD